MAAYSTAHPGTQDTVATEGGVGRCPRHSRGTLAAVSGDERRVAGAVLGLAVLAGALSLDGGFVYDDTRALFENPVVNGAVPAVEAWTRDFWGRPVGDVIVTYRPLLPLLWRGLWAAAPQQPFGFRLLSLLLHVLATASALYLLRASMRSAAQAAAAAALFAVHPVHSEALGAIVSHADLLSAAMGMWALGIALRHPQRSLSTAGLVLLSCLGKESGVMFGIGVVAVVWLRDGPGGEPSRRTRLLQAAPTLIVVGAVVALQLSLTRTSGELFDNSLARALDGPMRLLYGLSSIGHASLLMIAPSGLAPHHGYAAVQPTLASLGPHALAGVIVVGCWIAWGLRSIRSRDPIGAGAVTLWAVPLVIMSGLVVLPQTDVAERLLYAPSVVIAGLLVALFMELGLRQRVRRVCLGAALVTGVLLSAEAQRAWTDNLSLWTRAVDVEPRSWHSRKNLASELAGADRQEEAVWHFLVALQLRRHYPRPFDWARVEQLEALELPQRLADAPGVLAPEDPCGLVRDTLANLQGAVPRVEPYLGPTYRARYCTR